jgi:hypothetical protein
MRPRLADHDLLRQGHKIYHAVDTNIFALYLDPERHAVETEERVAGVGEIFRKDERERKESIAAALGEFIWNQLQPGVPLLLVPPINQEIDNSVGYYVREFEQRDRNESVELAQIQKQLRKHNHQLSEEDLQTLRHAVMVDSSAAAAMRRMKFLFSELRLKSADSELPRSAFNDAIRSAVRSAMNIPEMFEFSQLKDAWQDRLRKVGRARGPTADHDFETMARLELYNNRLSREGDGKTILLYITTDTSLFNAGETYKVCQNSTTFARRFLRHPRAYLNEPEVLRPTRVIDHRPEASVTLAEWLQVLLGRLDELGEIHSLRKGRIKWSAKAIKAIDELASKDQQAASKILDEWSKYEAAASLELPDSYMRGLSSAAAGGKDLFLAQLQELRPQIQRKKDLAWENCFYVSTSARFILQVIGGTGAPAREVPSLVFESRPKLLSFLNDAKKWFDKEEEFSLQAYQEHRAAVIGEEHNRYGDYLSHAYLMALQMQWRTAAIFAARAREHVPDGPPVPTRSNGREALYFEAFCRRYSANTLDDLDELEPLLDKAGFIAASEIAFADKEGWILNPVVERFQAERFALRISRLLFQWKNADDKGKPDFLAQMAEMIPDLYRFYKAANRRIQELPESGEGLNRHIPISKQREALQDVSIRTLRNILAIGLQVPSARKQAENAWRELLTIDRDRAVFKRRGSFISEFFYWSSLAHFGETREVRRDARRKIKNEFSEHVMEKNKVFPYDVKRFLDIAHQVEESV